MIHPRSCPACGAVLRDHIGRLCCGACEGIMLTVEDFKRSIDDLIRLPPELAFRHDKPSARPCPRCTGAMTACRIELQILDKHITPRVDLERCAGGEGIWFDPGALAKVYLAIERVFGAHGGNTGGTPDDGPLGSYGKFNAPP